MELTSNELRTLRIAHHHADLSSTFSVQVIPHEFLNVEFRSLQRLGCVAKVTGVFYKITPAGLDALHQAALAAEQEHQRIQQLSKQVADDRAYAERQKLTHDAKVAADQRKQYAHDFKVAAFSIAGALLVEHFGVVVDFISKVVEYVSSLLH